MWRIMGEDSANVQIGAELLCKSVLGLEPGLGLGLGLGLEEAEVS